MGMTPIERTFTTMIAALLLGALVAFSSPSAFGFAFDGLEAADGFADQDTLELAQQRVPLESVIASVQAQCPGRLVNARYDGGSNRYIIRWETSQQQIVSIQADATTGRILSTGGC